MRVRITVRKRRTAALTQPSSHLQREKRTEQTAVNTGGESIQRQLGVSERERERKRKRKRKREEKSNLRSKLKDEDATASAAIVPAVRQTEQVTE